MNHSGNARIAVMATLATFTVLGYQACSTNHVQSRKDTSTTSSPAANTGGKGGLIDGSNGGTTTDNPKPTVNVVMQGFDTPGVSDAHLCIGSLSFSRDDEQEDENEAQTTSASLPSSNWGSGNANDIAKAAITNALLSSSFPSGYDASDLANWITAYLDSQMLALLPAGTFVNTVSLPSGSYGEVDMQLSSDCTGGSLSIKNSSGALQIIDPVTIKFFGSLDLAPGSDKLTLNIQPVLAQIASAKSGDDIKRILQQTYGTL